MRTIRNRLIPYYTTEKF